MTEDQITIHVNSSPKTATAGQSLTEIISTLSLQSTKGIAVAVNDSVVPRDNWDQHQLENNDSILIITATQGG